MSSKKSSDPEGAEASAASAESSEPTETAPEKPVKYSAEHDEELRRIFNLAEDGRWEEAENRAEALYQRDPTDTAVQRTLNWVQQQHDLIRAQAVEDRIRQIDSQNSVFNPTVPSLLTEQKDRGLPPRKDLRDAIDQIESMPYVPESYGKTIRKKGRLFDLETEEGSMARILKREISVHLDNVTLESIIFNIGEAEGINFVADRSLPAFQQKLSVNLDKVELAEFLRYVSRNMNVHFQVGDELIWVLDGQNPAQFEETRFYRLRKGFMVPAQFGPMSVDITTTKAKDGTITEQRKEEVERFVRDRVDSPSIEEAIKRFFKGSDYMIDFERNLIVATGTPEQLEVLENIIEEFDKPIQQIFIEARFVTVTEAAFMQLGAQWETGRGPLSGERSARDFTALGTDVGLGLQETFPHILGRENLSVTLTALEQSGESQTLSAPQLTLLNNRPARISDGKIQYYYEEYIVQQTVVERATSASLVPKGKPTKLTSGVSLEVVASVGGDAESIVLALHPEVNQDVELVTFATLTDRNVNGEIVSTFDIKLPESRTQELSTRVSVKSGQTVVMGGVLEREQRTFVESVPLLGNIPIIGAAFRKRTEVDKPRYLLIFVTATLLAESGEFIVFEDR